MTPLPLSKNRVIFAVAGSGKTSFLVDKALSHLDKKILFLTYTNENLNNIKKSFQEKNGFLPENVETKCWFTFLLRDGVRPYHNYLSLGKRASSINFVSGSSWSNPALRGVPESNIEKYYFDKDRRIYTDKISKYAYKCNEKSHGLVINRLEQIYDYIFIDEVQDLAGWDLDFIERLLLSKIKIVLVGDPRQVTYLTNHAPKNTQYKGEKIVNFFKKMESNGLCSVINNLESNRCNQDICNLADLIYPNLPKSISLNKTTTGHDGIFYIKIEDLEDYINTHKPTILRYDKRSDTKNKHAFNFGITKGLTFDRVLIVPTESIKKFLNTKNSNTLAEGTKAKLYVAITRARYSVTFVN
jgi:DNA helicase-2/ATP-dependent DNA helicase PcrA